MPVQDHRSINNLLWQLRELKRRTFYARLEANAGACGPITPTHAGGYRLAETKETPSEKSEFLNKFTNNHGPVRRRI